MYLIVLIVTILLLAIGDLLDFQLMVGAGMLFLATVIADILAISIYNLFY
ncbi:MAG: hypothetical protein GY951_08975 [Psychromonas sp.]|nr:hypothetical protein [Alteromonadales bacterium]MCP5078171.1 hypothetical protein [Psychromonas sp.]